MRKLAALLSLVAGLFAQNSNSIPFDWVSADLHGFIHRRNDEDIEMLEMNNSIHLQVLKGNPVARSANLICVGFET